MFEPVKVAFSHYVTRFYNGLMPTTKPMIEFCGRGVGKSIVWTVSRIADSPQEILESWQRNDTDSAPTQPYKFPVIIIAMSRDYLPTGADYTRQVTDFTKIIIPNDPKERVFGVRTISSDLSVKVVIFAADDPTAKSIAAQFSLFVDSFANRRFAVTYRFAMVDTLWTAQLESDEFIASKVALESQNLACLSLDLTLKVQVPLFDAPKLGEPNDDKGVPETDDPAGYLV